MSLNQIIDDNTGLPAESWKNFKVNKLNAEELDFTTATIDDLTVTNDLEVQGNVVIVGDISSVSGMLVLNNISTNSLTFPGQSVLNQYRSEPVNGLTLSYRVGGVPTVLDNDYQVKCTRIGDMVTINFEKTFVSPANNVQDFVISGMPSFYRPTGDDVNCPIVLAANLQSEVVIARLDNGGGISIFRTGGNLFVNGDGVNGNDTKPCLTFSI